MVNNLNDKFRSCNINFYKEFFSNLITWKKYEIITFNSKKINFLKEYLKPTKSLIKIYFLIFFLFLKVLGLIIR